MMNPVRRSFLRLFAAAPIAAAIAETPVPAATSTPLVSPADQPFDRGKLIAGIRQTIARWDGIIANRPPAPGAALGLDLPNTAGCEHRCKPCRMECAIAPNRRDWWIAELARVREAGQ